MAMLRALLVCIPFLLLGVGGCGDNRTLPVDAGVADAPPGLADARSDGPADGGDASDGARPDASDGGDAPCLDEDGDTVCDEDDQCPGFDDLADTDGDSVANQCDNCPTVENPDQAACEDETADTLGDACDDDDDGDGVLDLEEEEGASCNAFACADRDLDGCDDCASGVFDPENDGPECGTEAGRDFLCDEGDPDDDQDGVPDATDGADCDPTRCSDTDIDGCDDCTPGAFDPANDGAECPNERGGRDGLCDLSDPDDDNDGALDPDDADDCDFVGCSDVDADSCDDCAGGAFDPANDGAECSAEAGGRDGRCDQGDPDDDNDLAPDSNDTSDCDPTICSDLDADGCDDCSGGSLAPGNDGPECAAEAGGRDGRCDAGDADDDNDGAFDGADTNDCDPAVCSDLDTDTCDDCSSGAFAPGSDGAECAAEAGGRDGRCDAGDADDDNDGRDDPVDASACDPFACADTDLDGCEDCTSGGFAPAADGAECAAEAGGRDGLCDGGDPDDDNDGVPDAADGNDCDPRRCSDQDGDGCDDCASGAFDPAADGAECAGESGGRDGLCDAGDPDDDDDGALDAADANDCDPSRCSDQDGDTCDDCSFGSFNPTLDGAECAAEVGVDGQCDPGDPDDDNDGVADALDSNDCNPRVCNDSDGDTCDDCANLADSPANDGADADGDGICDAGDNCDAVANPGQADGDADTVGDACDVCPGGDDRVDGDADTVPDFCDVCPGGDDRVDGDGDTVPDFCDACPGGDDRLDADGDTVPDFCDVCPGGDDALDADGDTVPDFCDVCPGGDDALDADGDTVPDFCDVCPGGDDRVDGDVDAVPDDCDNCPSVANPSQTDADLTPGLPTDGGDACDNCDDVHNPGQEDGDGLSARPTPFSPIDASDCVEDPSFDGETDDLNLDDDAVSPIIMLADDDGDGTVEPGEGPFDLQYFGKTITAVQISSNGFVYLLAAPQTQAPGSTAGTIPRFDGFDDVVAAAWTDLDGSIAAGCVSFQILGGGSSTDQTLEITWEGVPVPGGGTVSTQIRIFEADDRIEIHTASQATGTNLVTRGIEGLFSTFVAAAHLAGQVRAPFVLSDDAAQYTSGLAPDGIGDACANRTIVATCGDGACFGGETNLSCPADCVCGDGLCDAASGETILNCPADCRCLDGICDASEQALPDGNCGLCFQDCGGNCCGSGVCDPGEPPFLVGTTLHCGCQFDCGPAGVSCCGDSVCDPANFESFANCPFDCF